MIDFLVKAYYEVKGSFDGLDRESYSSYILEAASKAKISAIEYCYRCLGYPCDNKYDAMYRAEIRKFSTNLKNYPEISDRFSIRGKDNVKPFLKSYNFFPKFDNGSLQFSKVPKNYRDLVRVLSLYFETTEHLTVHSNDGVKSTLGSLFSYLKLQTTFASFKKEVDEYVSFIQPLLNNLNFNQKYETQVIDGVMQTNVSFDKPVLAKDICWHIGCRYFSMNTSHYYFLIQNLGAYQFQSYSNPYVYLAILDLSYIYGMTVKQLIEHLGFKYVNQLEIFEETGVFIYQLNARDYVIINPLSSTYNPQSIQLDKLKDLYLVDGLKLVGREVQ